MTTAWLSLLIFRLMDMGRVVAQDVVVIKEEHGAVVARIHGEPVVQDQDIAVALGALKHVIQYGFFIQGDDLGGWAQQGKHLAAGRCPFL